MRIQVENIYADGYQSTYFFTVSDKKIPDNYNELDDLLYGYTGDRGNLRLRGSLHIVTVLWAQDRALDGYVVEWIDE